MKRVKRQRKMKHDVAGRYIDLFKRRMKLFSMRNQFNKWGFLARLSNKYQRIEDLIYKINLDLWVLKNLNEVPMTISYNDKF